jgi:4,5-dihydroxyphthalate decarboxylase
MWSEYGLPWKEVHWRTDTEESMPYEPLKGTSIKRLPQDANIGDLLDRGDLDAIFRPHPPKAVLRGSKNIVPLFADSKREEERYFSKNGFYPIMHVIVFRNEILKKFPEAALIFMHAFQKADEICEHYYDDPNWSRLAWGRHYLEQERKLMGASAWPHGIERNRNNLERFLGYSLELGLIKRIPQVDTLFADSTRDT